MRLGFSEKYCRLAATVLVALALASVSPASLVQAQTLAFKQAVATAAAQDEAIAAFYQERDFQPIWTGNGDRERRKAFLDAVSRASDHGLPAGRYDPEQLKLDFGSFKSAKARGILEVETTKRFLQYAQDISSGILEPLELDDELYIKPPRRDRLEMLHEFSTTSPQAFLRDLPPKHPDYTLLLKEKMRLELVLGNGGWGEKVSGRGLKPGRSSDEVVNMRRRLTTMGYMKLGISPDYNDVLEAAVSQFQEDHGLNIDGVAGSATLEALNVSAQTRLQQVIVGLERQRWLNKPRGKRHIFVNQADFRAHVMDDGKPSLTTRVVIGKAGRFRTPEFTDEMTHLIINPTWHVPQSIARNEYLPQLKKNPAALGRLGLVMTDVRGQRVDPTQLDYSQYNSGSFPFDLKQPPGAGNALGKVKFMFPNHFNVYLHDTPSKSLFKRDMRAYSHGCVRVQKPFELAYTLLSLQSDTPEDDFHDALNSRRETQIDLVNPIPVHLVYHTVWVTPNGRSNYRMDTYQRDRKIFSALQKVGVELIPARS